MSMTTASSFASYQMDNHCLGSHQRMTHASLLRPYSLPRIFPVKQSLYYLNTNHRGRPKLTIKMDMNAINNINSGAPGPSGSPFPGWSNWMLLTILPMILPFFKSKWGPLLAIYKKVDTAIETVECLSEVVEDVAKKVDKIADEVAENLPEGSKLKDVICMVDDVAEGVIKGADFIQEVAQKVEDVEEKIESLIEENKSMDRAEIASKNVKNVQVDDVVKKVETNTNQ